MDADNPIVRRLGPEDAAAYRQVRLDALMTNPTAFGASFEDEERLTLDVFRDRLPADGASAVFGALDRSAIVGTAGFLASDRPKTRHRGVLWGVFVRPAWQGRGLGRILIETVIAHALAHVRIVQTAVVSTNSGARRLYAALGFVPYGIERAALCVDGVFLDEELMALDSQAMRETAGLVST